MIRNVSGTGITFFFISINNRSFLDLYVWVQFLFLYISSSVPVLVINFYLYPQRTCCAQTWCTQVNIHPNKKLICVYLLGHRCHTLWVDIRVKKFVFPRRSGWRPDSYSPKTISTPRPWLKTPVTPYWRVHLNKKKRIFFVRRWETLYYNFSVFKKIYLVFFRLKFFTQKLFMYVIT